MRLPSSVVALPRRRHARASAGTGYRSGRNSCRETPVSRSIGRTNSPGTPRLERDSQYQTCDCVVPMRSASGFCPPTASQARLSASVADMSLSNPNLGESQPKTLCGTANSNFGSIRGMRTADSKGFGRRVRARREQFGWTQEQLAEKTGFSQSNIGWIESGKPKKGPEVYVVKLSLALEATQEWLLYGEGEPPGPPPYPTKEEIAEAYEAMSTRDKIRFAKAMGFDPRKSR